MKHLTTTLFVLAVMLRTVTAYTLEVSQTDLTPCIGAFGDNLCERIKMGTTPCAANWVKRGTELYIPGYGRCKVLDRMAKKNGQKVDILFADKRDAIKWGSQRLKVELY